MKIIRRNILSPFLFFILLYVYSCSKEKVYNIGEYRKDLLSNDANKICEASYYLGEAKDIVSVPLLLNNLNDPRISHNIRYKGMSVYYCKTGALNKISGLELNIKQHTEPDSAIIKIFYNWAIKKNIISH